MGAKRCECISTAFVMPRCNLKRWMQVPFAPDPSGFECGEGIMRKTLMLRPWIEAVTSKVPLGSKHNAEIGLLCALN